MLLNYQRARIKDKWSQEEYIKFIYHIYPIVTLSNLPAVISGGLLKGQRREINLVRGG